MTQHHLNGRRVPDDIVAKLRKMVILRGIERAAKDIGSSTTMVRRILGPGVVSGMAFERVVSSIRGNAGVVEMTAPKPSEEIPNQDDCERAARCNPHGAVEAWLVEQFAAVRAEGYAAGYQRAIADVVKWMNGEGSDGPGFHFITAEDIERRFGKGGT
jgi:hypothetical protein